MKRFKRGVFTNEKDERGRVSILIRLCDTQAKRGYVQGNRTVTLTALDATVGEVASAIITALFEGETNATD